jgi:hypothetical protein
MEWNFSNIPESEHEKIHEHIKFREVDELIRIHDKYDVSAWIFCCGTDQESKNDILILFQYAIDKGFINRSEKGY